MSSVFWDITPCSLLIINRRFGRASPPYSLLMNKPSKKPARGRGKQSWSPARLFFDPEDGGDVFLRNVS
jgi:hypothetical protein